MSKIRGYECQRYEDMNIKDGVLPQEGSVILKRAVLNINVLSTTRGLYLLSTTAIYHTTKEALNL